MVMVFIIMLMDVDMKVNQKMELRMDQGNFIMKMEIFMKENIRMGK